MPPRYHYWTIILEGQPTAFRAHAPDELIPTLRQLQARHPDAVMKWFARGRLWESQEAERAEAAAKRTRGGASGDRRGREWRPGGQHQDPRDRFKVPRDEKRRRFAAKARRDRVEAPPADRPAGPRTFGKPSPHRARSPRNPGARKPGGGRGGRER